MQPTNYPNVSSKYTLKIMISEEKFFTGYSTALLHYLQWKFPEDLFQHQNNCYGFIITF